jgi:hypothetical protein
MALSTKELKNIRDSFTKEQLDRHDEFIEENYKLTITLCDLMDKTVEVTEEHLQSLKDAYTAWHFHVYRLMNTLYEEDFENTTYEDEIEPYINSIQNDEHRANVEKIGKFFSSQEWGMEHVQFMNEIMGFITNNDTELYKVLSLIEKETVDEEGEVTEKCQKSMKDALTNWYKHTFNFTQMLYEKVGADEGSEIMQEIQMEYQKGTVEKMQTYFFEKDWGMKHFKYLQETYGDEHNLE